MISTIIFTFLIIYILIGTYLYVKQRNYLYFETPISDHAFEEKIFINNGIEIKTTVLNQDNKNSIIYFGGNSEIAEYSAECFHQFFPDHTIYLVKYRGYSGTQGLATEKNLYSDALHIFDTIKPNYKKISIIGRSLGSGIATYLASKREIQSLTLVTPFDSVQKVAQKKFPIYPMAILLKEKYNSIQRVKDIKAKTLIITAQYDKVVKHKHTKRLFDKFPSSQVILKMIQDTDHDSISSTKEYYVVIKSFIQTNT